MLGIYAVPSTFPLNFKSMVFQGEFNPYVSDSLVLNSSKRIVL